MSETAQSPAQQFVAKRRSGGSKLSALIVSFTSLAAILSLGALMVVFVIPNEEEPVFIAKKTVYLPQRELEHKMSMSEFQQAAAAPTSISKLSTETMLSDIPPMPELPVNEFTPVENENPYAMGDGLFGGAGLMGAMTGLSTQPSEVSILGINDSAERFVIAIDISQSVVTEMNKVGKNITDIRDEAIKLIEQLNSNTQFGLIQHSRNYDMFQPYIVTATVDNKQAAISWFTSKFRTDGNSAPSWTRDNPNGIQSVINAAFRMEPDVIFLVSDASYQRNSEDPKSTWGEDVPWKELERDISNLQKQLTKEARIHFIGFGVEDDDGKEMKSLIRKNGGKYKEY